MPTVAEIIRDRRDDIMARWVEVSRKAAASRGLERPELLNILPEYVGALARDSDEAEREALMASHFASRLRQGFHVGEIVDELALLGRVISEQWARPDVRRPAPEDVDALHAELHRRSASILDMFAEHMESDEQDEKRIARELEHLARAARIASAPLDAVARELLSAAMTSMGAQTAALRVYEGSAEAIEVPIVTVSVGLGGHDLVRLTGAERSTPLGQSVSRSHLPHQTQDMRAEELEVTDGLARSGIRSLVGVRLPPQHDLEGVLYVGIVEQRAFSAREIRRLELVGERLLTHVGAARLDEVLGRSNEDLRAAAASQAQFVALLAHDLRGPLSVAKMGARLILDQPETATTRELAVKIERNLDRIDKMARDLLDAHHIRAGQALPLKIAECDLARLVHQVAEELSTIHGDRFELETPELLIGTWDCDELRRAIWNLGTNAVKYGDRARPISIGAERVGETACISVHNFGKTIPKDQLDHIFDAHVQARSQDRRGWGLGLTLVRGCAEAHGGSVRATSQNGETTFTIELPLRAPPVA